MGLMFSQHTMIGSETIRLARIEDALCIAEMSRDLIESGLGWTWTKARIVNEIRAKNANVIVTVEGNELVGFAIMKYQDSEARLNLFAVNPQHRRKGVGRRMINWLEKTALINGSSVVYLEVRLGNDIAKKFYLSLGYKIIQRIPGYYKGRESAIRMARDLWQGESPA